MKDLLQLGNETLTADLVFLRVNLLRAHEQDVHAENMEAAISVVASLISNELGRDTLAQAMSWVSDEVGGSSELSQIVTTPH